MAALQASTQTRWSFAQSSTSDAQFRRGAPHQQPNLNASSSTKIPGGNRTVRPTHQPVRASANAAPTRENEQFLAEFKAQIEEQHVISKTIAAATQQIPVDQKLQADGKNYAAWVKLINTVVLNHLGVEDFFFRENRNPYLERVGRAVILASVHFSLVPDLQDIAASNDMYLAIKKKFKTVSFAGQLNLWNQFLSFTVDQFPSSAGIALHLRNMVSDWRSINVKMNTNTFLAFILISAIWRDDSISEIVLRRLEDLVQRKGLPPTFDQVVHLLELAQQQLSLTATTAVFSNPITSATPPVIMSADIQPPSRPEVAGVADNMPDDFDVYAATVNHCWQCNSSDHFLRDCPYRAWPDNFNRKIRGPGSVPFQPNQSQIFPIVGAVYPPVQLNQPRYMNGSGRPYQTAGPPPYPRPNFNARQPNTRPTRPADSYVPHPRRVDQRNNAPSQLRQSQVGANAAQFDIGEVDYDFSNLNFQLVNIHDNDLLEGAVPQFQELEISTSDSPMAE